jgi:hypothetical protein
MTNRMLTVAALLASVGLGVGVALLWSAPNGAGADANREGSIAGVRSEAVGSDGTSTQPENTIEAASSVDGSIQSIPGIEGIDTIAIQNLEAVLRMQTRPTESSPRGGVSTAAALMTMEGEPQEELEEIDGREELEELELEGS